LGGVSLISREQTSVGSAARPLVYISVGHPEVVSLAGRREGRGQGSRGIRGIGEHRQVLAVLDIGIRRIRDHEGQDAGVVDGVGAAVGAEVDGDGLQRRGIRDL